MLINIRITMSQSYEQRSHNPQTDQLVGITAIADVKQQNHSTKEQKFNQTFVIKDVTNGGQGNLFTQELINKIKAMSNNDDKININFFSTNNTVIKYGIFSRKSPLTSFGKLVASYTPEQRNGINVLVTCQKSWPKSIGDITQNQYFDFLLSPAAGNNHNFKKDMLEHIVKTIQECGKQVGNINVIDSKLDHYHGLSNGEQVHLFQSSDLHKGPQVSSSIHGAKTTTTAAQILNNTIDTSTNMPCNIEMQYDDQVEDTALTTASEVNGEVTTSEVNEEVMTSEVNGEVKTSEVNGEVTEQEGLLQNSMPNNHANTETEQNATEELFSTPTQNTTTQPDQLETNQGSYDLDEKAAVEPTENTNISTVIDAAIAA